MFDLLIKNARVVDGTGLPSYRADVAVESGRIAAISPRLCAEAREVIDAAGLILTGASTGWKRNTVLTSPPSNSSSS